MRNWSYRTWIEPDFTVLGYPRKVVIWLLVPSGRTVLQRVREGLLACNLKARLVEREQGCVLADVGKVLPPVEWAVADLAASGALDKFLNIRADPKVIAGALWKVDSSHAPFVEINQAPGGSVEAPTEVAERLEWLLMRGRTAMTDIQEQVATNAASSVTLAQQVDFLRGEIARLVEVIKDIRNK